MRRFRLCLVLAALTAMIAGTPIHAQSVPDSHEIWFGVLGPGIAPGGENAGGPSITASQFAQTIASLLGFTFVADHPVGGKIALQTR